MLYKKACSSIHTTCSLFTRKIKYANISNWACLFIGRLTSEKIFTNVNHISKCVWIDQWVLFILLSRWVYQKKKSPLFQCSFLIPSIDYFLSFLLFFLFTKLKHEKSRNAWQITFFSYSAIKLFTSLKLQSYVWKNNIFFIFLNTLYSKAHYILFTHWDI